MNCVLNVKWLIFPRKQQVKIGNILQLFKGKASGSLEISVVVLRVTAV